jgi:uncharacterized protein (TIGR02266 family)
MSRRACRSAHVEANAWGKRRARDAWEDRRGAFVGHFAAARVTMKTRIGVSGGGLEQEGVRAMNQDTRKDRRVKIVSLNVRYKSATVDEFIENHAHDVSRGGIYIKTASPFPPGTLLKFEIRLASDQAVIAGVGRVVWKREGTPLTTERPAGMGVKFIKIDEPSKTVIDKLVNTKADAGKAFESEAEMPASFHEPPAAKIDAAVAKLEAPAAGKTDAPAAKVVVPTATAMLTQAAPGARPMPPRKATMMGLGIPSSSPPPLDPPSSKPGGRPSAAPRPGPVAGMFPSADADDELPKADQTVMKQAAELLEEALREAGGSMEEIGTNPLFSGSTPAPAPRKSSAPTLPSDRAPAAPQAPEVKGPSLTESKRPSAAPTAVEVKTPSIEPGAKARDADEAARARAMVAGMSPAPRRGLSEPPRTTRESPSAKVTAVSASAQTAPKKGGGGVFILLFVVVAAAAGAVVLYRDRLFGSPEAPTSTSTASTPAATPSAAASAAASAAPSASAAASASAEPEPSSSAAPSASASAAAAPSATAASATATTATVAVTATAAPTRTAPVPTATAAPVPTVAPRPTATATAAPTATATAAPRPKPKPADDNPY